MMPRTVTMPVVESTEFSTIATLPASDRPLPGIEATTFVADTLIASRRSASTRCGTENDT